MSAQPIQLEALGDVHGRRPFLLDHLQDEGVPLKVAIFTFPDRPALMIAGTTNCDTLS